MTQGDEITAVATRFLGAFSDADFETMRSLLAPDLAAWVTNASGGADRLDGRDEYLARIEAMDLPSARFSVELTQPPVAVGSDHVLVMVEVRAERADRTLHNFAAHLLRIDGGTVREWWMTEAKPAESDRFWA